jgi:beta-exotoxin I transport system permease protein
MRLVSTASVALGLIAVLLAVGALFPAVGHTLGKLNIPKGVADLLGGADYGTITGWYRSEIASIYGPLVIAAIAITGVSATTAGEEEDRILSLLLAHPVTRARLIAAKAGAIAIVVVAIAVATFAGMVAGVALAGGGISLGHIAAFSVALAFFGFATGAVALALGAATGQRSLATAVAAGVGLLGWLLNGFAPLVGSIAWLKYVSLFYYYEGGDPLTRGLDVVDLVVLAVVTIALTAFALISIGDRDLTA